VATDGLNQKVITGDSKGILKFWRFKTKQLVGKLGRYRDRASGQGCGSALI
jgi:hypothetical protein